MFRWKQSAYFSVQTMVIIFNNNTRFHICQSDFSPFVFKCRYFLRFGQNFSAPGTFLALAKQKRKQPHLVTILWEFFLFNWHFFLKRTKCIKYNFDSKIKKCRRCRLFPIRFSLNLENKKNDWKHSSFIIRHKSDIWTSLPTSSCFYVLQFVPFIFCTFSTISEVIHIHVQ